VKQGRIVRAMAGYYHVYSAGDIYLTKPRGLFRLENITPTVGDKVDFEPDILHMEGTIISIYPRDNLLLRPRVSNISSSLMVFSLSQPVPDYLLLDKLICNSISQGIEPILVFNKCDLDQEERKRAKEIYSLTPYSVHFVSALTGQGIDDLRQCLGGGIHVVSGPSGSGKSSLLNAFGVKHEVEVGEISSKLKRGRHTTRHVQLLPIEEDTFIVDTPGFSNLDLNDNIDPLLLRECFEEFIPFMQECRYDNCLHAPEPQCGVKTALKNSLIHPKRYENYLTLLDILQSRKDYL